MTMAVSACHCLWSIWFGTPDFLACLPAADSGSAARAAKPTRARSRVAGGKLTLNATTLPRGRAGRYGASGPLPHPASPGRRAPGPKRPESRTSAKGIANVRRGARLGLLCPRRGALIRSVIAGDATHWRPPLLSDSRAVISAGKTRAKQATRRSSRPAGAGRLAGSCRGPAVVPLAAGRAGVVSTVRALAHLADVDDLRCHDGSRRPRQRRPGPPVTVPAIGCRWVFPWPATIAIARLAASFLGGLREAGPTAVAAAAANDGGGVGSALQASPGKEEKREHVMEGGREGGGREREAREGRREREGRRGASE